MRVMNEYQKACSAEFSRVQALAEAAVAKSVGTLQAFWMASIEAEEAGDITRALEIHGRILDEVGRSYVAYLRSGWLHGQAGGYVKSLEYYEKASRRSPGSVAPLFGAMGCYVAMGDSYNASRMVKTIIDLDVMDEATSLQFAALRPNEPYEVLAQSEPVLMQA